MTPEGDTYPSVLEVLNHSQRFLDVRDLVLETPSSLIQITVHVSILPEVRPSR